MSADATTERAALEAALAGREGWELFPCDPALADILDAVLANGISLHRYVGN